MNKAKAASITAEKWSEEVTKHGFQIVPTLLLKKQAVLGITAPEMVVLLNLLMHWWTRESAVFPSAEEIAERIGINRRSVDRSVDGLIKKELLRKERQGNLVLYDPTPLADKLREISRRRKAEGEQGRQAEDEQEVPF